jgi:ABC-type microcin C transport system permease subunit YejB
MSTHLTFPGFHGIWEFDMAAAGEDTKSLTNVWKKTNEQQLFNELEDEYGFPRATCRSLVQLMHEFIEDNYGNLRTHLEEIVHTTG